jgi:hypothetical protein
MILWPIKLVDNPHITTEKSTEMFCENIKMLLFEDEEYKEPIFENYNIDKKLRVFM